MKPILLNLVVVVLVLLPVVAAAWPFLERRYRARRGLRTPEESTPEWEPSDRIPNRAGNLQPARLRARPWRSHRLSCQPGQRGSRGRHRRELRGGD